MSFGRQKRLLLGILALLAPLPLPFNEIVSWPFLAAYWAALGLFLYRTFQAAEGWLPNWAVNLLGLLYLPFLFLDFTVLWQGQLVRPLMHLAMFALAVKLFALHRERDKWHAVIGTFFIFLAAMATSVHPAIVSYLVAVLVLALLVLARFAFFHVLAGFGYRAADGHRIPLRGVLTVSTVLILGLAVPLFAFLPRLRSPYIVGRGTGTGTVVHASGFSDEVTLDDIGRVRTNRAVAMRLAYDGPPPAGHEMRYKAAAYDIYRGRSWRRSAEVAARLGLAKGGHFKLAPREPVAWVRVWLQPLGTPHLVLPVESVAVGISTTSLTLDEGGAVLLPRASAGILEYGAGMSPGPVPLAPAPGAAGAEAALDTSGVTPRMAALGARVMGEGSARERARRLETYLIQGYEYTLDFVGRMSEEPLEDFLFRYRSGHCEYFASAMVLLLRSQGIPARLVTGFLGAEYNPLEGYFIVRQLNAHAWVEAYLPGEGWRIFDPTPPAGRPGSQTPSLRLLFTQAWDFVLFRWDRYVLTYGFYDQLRALIRLRDLWFWAWRQLQGPAGTEAVPAGGEGSGAAPAAEGEAGSWEPSLAVWAALLMAVLALAAWSWQRRPRLTATRAYVALRRRLDAAGAPLAPWSPPLEVRRRLGRRYPEAAGPASQIIDSYLRESFAGEELSAEERRRLGEALRQARRWMRQAG